ncbi:TonB-dependent receptor [Bdellovibrio sp. HCB2-146]|uniref:TonB-dependent receptor n=1 Tax=Bdellovibrio sp. HCB2-146 TaxID=3394362 RepID=UPI0039BD10AB
MKCLSFFIFSAVFIFSSFSSAKETDNLTGRYKTLQDSTEVLDKEMNRRLQELVAEANSDGIACDKSPETFRKIRVLFHEQNKASFQIGSMESWAEKNDKIAKRKASPDGSIYEGVLSKGLIFNNLDLASTIKVNGELIGTDKLGHFIDQGFERYRYFRERGNRMDVALDGSKGMESSIYGAASTGIVSSADMMANYHGILFYHALVDTNNPYLTCSGGTWSQVRNFTWADYVDAGWDEGINCVSVEDAKARAIYDKNVSKLEAKAREQGKDQTYRCPVDPEACGKLRSRYSFYETKKGSPVLSDVCIQVGKSRPARPGNSGGSGTKASGAIK